jgi:hypothetical protein
MFVMIGFVICVARKGLWWNAWHETRVRSAAKPLVMGLKNDPSPSWATQIIRIPGIKNMTN